MQSIKEIKVALDFGSKADPVGRLAIRDNIIYFEYDEEFVQRGLEISPFHLPLKNGLSELPQTPFDGLAGVFGDSLPDGWGRLLFDRIMRAKGILPTDINSLDRLANVGLYGMGALVYEPDNSHSLEDELIDLDQLASQAEQVLEGNSEEVLKELLVLNGSSAGARPKALIGVDFDRKNISYGAKKLGEGFENWLVKFPNSQDGLDAGAIEYVYALMAKEAGLDIPDVHLFKAKKGCGYFAVKRFDRDGNRRLHMHTVAGLIHTNFRYPSLDYEDLIGLTFALTKDAREVEKMFRMAVFNVFANNRDDHAKNFSFLMDETGEWKLSPAYDLTFSSGPGGEQSMMVMGEGRNIEVKHLIKLGEEAKLSNAIINGIIEQTRFALSYWPYLAKEYGILDSNIELISRAITKL
ncbi:phosphatidylinositol kinase [Chryseobacterium formosense]|uniref:Phosphatidylinositol kinase n=1 Tax=Chryseobacterium formosense TaxID=236814 RepID=A0A085Z1C9_9FLAO|nr:type II toxin-antitoxin system HipA family toxin [Chryseobacterium formosense]KFE98242.1 phosphatidylinositol kinase [Chryseobacterium formosense]SFT74681.1 serine/threonine-protein kinase HipA [Chryseobacterium formosense]